MAFTMGKVYTIQAFDVLKGKFAFRVTDWVQYEGVRWAKFICQDGIERTLNEREVDLYL
ncbi:hypothetical protein DNHGIG_40560 [Collibacillus ludicampi]|uniref:Uncharacterized protein n=2 Tax=Collibacillus ludicampi TaxID=2771369 RepID=A0AAV4LNI4_9BACL|nr:hypothetical protein DNHGIG_40560 [Collibacillus ludicampi]